jgi:DNA (cytosine-5)-methyltransferase 1
VAEHPPSVARTSEESAATDASDPGLRCPVTEKLCNLSVDECTLGGCILAAALLASDQVSPIPSVASGPVHVELFGAEGGSAHGYATALAPGGVTVWSVDNDPARHEVNPYAWFTGDWYEGLQSSPPCTKNTAGTRAVDRSRYDNDPDLENVRDVLEQTGLPYIIENVESEVTKRKMISPLRLCGTEFGLQADDPTVEQRLWLRRHRLFESNLTLMGAGGCRHPKGLRCAGAYGGARRDEVEARTIRKGGYVPKDIEVLRALLGAPPWMTEKGLFLCIPSVYAEHLGVQLLAHLALEVAA